MATALAPTSPRASTGGSTRAQLESAVDEALQAALQGLEGQQPTAALVFATVGYDQQALLDCVAERLPDDIVISGCSGEGVISDGCSFEGSHALNIVLFSGSAVSFHPVFAPRFSEDASACGHCIADQVDAVDDAKVLLVFPDGMTGNATQMLDALHERLPGLLVAGGAAGDMLAFEKTYQYANGRAESDGVAGMVISGNVRGDINVNHGCRPIGRAQTVTASDGVAVSAIDGQPAWEVFQEYIGKRDQLEAMDIVHLCLGRPVRGEGDSDYGEYVIRMPLGHDESGAVRFPGGLEAGTQVRMTRRDPGRITQAATDGAQALAREAPDAFVVLQFDCAGRGLMLFGSGASSAIAAPIRDAFPASVPVVGLHTFGEIAPLAGRAEYHNYTVVLLALSEVP